MMGYLTVTMFFRQMTLFASVLMFLLDFVIASSVIVPATLPVTSFCAGYYYSCALFNNNKIKCWGYARSWGVEIVNAYERIGDNVNEIGIALPYVLISDGTSLMQKMTCGDKHMCVKFDSGSLKCIGSNSDGQIGTLSKTLYVGVASGQVGDNVLAVDLGFDVKVLDVALGTRFTCAVVTGNQVKCFGYNFFGQLGYEDTTNRGKGIYEMGENLTAIDLGTNVTASSIHTGTNANHVCAILLKPVASNQRIKCWGFGTYYQLGYGDQFSRGDAIGEMGDNLPLVDLGSESRVKQLSFGWKHTCALLLSDVLKCFGDDGFGQVGSGSTLPVSSTGNSMPSMIIDFGKTVKIIASAYETTCVVYDDNVTAKCIGMNNLGQLGQGDFVSRGNAPETTIPNVTAIDFGIGTTKISSLICGSFHCCIVLENSLIKCWGFALFGQLGTGNINPIGDGPGEMGTNLQYAQLFGPTQSPTTSPSKSPTQPTKSPTMTPTYAPSTASPTTSIPTKNPTLPTHAPTKPPTKVPTNVPTLNPITLKPTTSAPTDETKSDGFTKAEVSFVSFQVTMIAFILLIA